MVDATIHGLDRGRILSDENYDLEAHGTASASEPNPTLERTEAPVYNLLIEHPEGTILWDTGSHPEAGEGYWPAPLYDAFEHVDAHEHHLADDLDGAGFDLADVDYVIQTHLHLDHAGGLYNFEGTDVPILVHRDELQWAYYSATTREGSAGYVKADFDRDLQWDVVHGDRVEPFEDLELYRLRGHSRGMLAMTIDLDGVGTLLFTSDLVDVAENYEEGHPPGPGLLWNRDRWIESIHELRDIERRRDATVIYGHEPAQLETILAGWP